MIGAYSRYLLMPSIDESTSETAMLLNVGYESMLLIWCWESRHCSLIPLRLIDAIYGHETSFRADGSWPGERSDNAGAVSHKICRAVKLAGLGAMSFRG